MLSFDLLRKKYPNFQYKSYDYDFSEGKLKVKYEFEIEGLCSFAPKWEFPAVSLNIDDELIENLVFSLGMVELISYWKCTCSPNVTVLPAGLDDEMIAWWKSLYFDGLGEFFYVNGISADLENFMQIRSEGSIFSPSVPLELNGNLVPVGGGKDSAVTLKMLESQKDVTVPYIINSRGATESTCEVSGYSDTAYRVKRTIDKKLIELNSQGFLNGHTPFSAIVAFSSLISAVINRKKYVVLSNESSANESTVLGENINHQFSKGEKFESAFIEYQHKYINCGVEYFSFLRPLSEMQIAMLFAQYKEFHKVFKSCNVGSKTDVWCCNCPKCLFVYTILSPFLSSDEMIGIFGENLFEKDSLLEIYRQLVGALPNKPFECVGSRDEVKAASAVVLNRLKMAGETVPYILNYFDENVDFQPSLKRYAEFYDKANHLPQDFESLLKAELDKYRGKWL